MNGDQQIDQETQKKLKGKWNNQQQTMHCTWVCEFRVKGRVIFFCFAVRVNKLLKNLKTILPEVWSMSQVVWDVLFTFYQNFFPTLGLGNFFVA